MPEVVDSRFVALAMSSMSAPRSLYLRRPLLASAGMHLALIAGLMAFASLAPRAPQVAAPVLMVSLHQKQAAAASVAMSVPPSDVPRKRPVRRHESPAAASAAPVTVREVPLPAAPSLPVIAAAVTEVPPLALDPVLLPEAYFQRLSRLVRIELLYPRDAHRRGEQGLAVVRVSLTRDGTVLDASITQGTGFPALDREAVDVIRRIGRFPPIPGDLRPDVSAFVLDQPVSFRIG
jgi:protein TonB